MKYLTQYVPQGSGISDGYVAIEEAGVLKVQKLTFDGTTATPDGTAEVIDNVGTTKGKSKSSCCVGHGVQKSNSAGSDHQLYAEPVGRDN